MGVTINWRLAQETKYVVGMLDDAEKYARQIEVASKETSIKVSVERVSPTQLYVDVGNCETVAFDFRPFKDWQKIYEAKGWDYTGAVLNDLVVMDKEQYSWCAEFYKTQFARSLAEHKMVCDLVKFVASRCRVAVVYDEGDYYHTGKIDNAGEAIAENGQMITDLVNALK